MPTRAVTRIVPHLWYVKEAEEAARFYAKIFPKSRIDRLWSFEPLRRGSVPRARVQAVRPAVLRDECRQTRRLQRHHLVRRLLPQPRRKWTATGTPSSRTAARRSGCVAGSHDKFGVRCRSCPPFSWKMADRDKKKAAGVAAESMQVKFDIARFRRPTKAADSRRRGMPERSAARAQPFHIGAPRFQRERGVADRCGRVMLRAMKTSTYIVGVRLTTALRQRRRKPRPTGRSDRHRRTARREHPQRAELDIHLSAKISMFCHRRPGRPTIVRRACRASTSSRRSAAHSRASTFAATATATSA